jgi:hypothetical protein
MRAALIVLVLAVTATAAQPPATRPIAITGVTVIDPAADASVPGMTVVIREGRIANAGADVSVPRGATVIDGRGQFLMPGLWDMHVHVSYTRESAFPAFVANGVTAVRDLGGDLAELDRWRTEIADGSRVGPLIVRAGPMLIGQNPLNSRFQLVIETPEQGRDTVRRLRAAGVEQIKVKPMSRDAYFAIVAEARALGLPVTGHIPVTVSPKEASDAGQSVEHVSTLFDGALRPRSGKDFRGEVALWRGTDEARELFQRFVRNLTFVDPTLAILERLSMRGEFGLPDPDWQYTAASARAEADKFFPVRYEATSQPRIPNADLREMQAVTRMMHDAGVKLLAGTDVSFINAPGFSLHDELDLLVAAGLPPAAALRAATSNPAALFPKLETGSIAPGRRADLVLLDANPLTDIRNARRIRAVVLAGKLFDRPALDRLLAEALELADKK